MADRHLARTKAVVPDGIFELAQSRVDLRIEVVGRDHHAKLALQSIGECLPNLHVKSCSCSCASCSAALEKSNASPEIVVRAEGFEPTSLAALEPKSSASASSATPAKGSPKPRYPRAGRLISPSCSRAPSKWVTD